MFVKISDADFLGVAEFLIKFQSFHLIKEFGHLNFEEKGFFEESVGGKELNFESLANGFVGVDVFIDDEVLGFDAVMVIALLQGPGDCIQQLYILDQTLDNNNKYLQILVVYVALFPFGNNVNRQILSEAHGRTF